MRTRAARCERGGVRGGRTEMTHLGLFYVCGVVVVCPGGGDHSVPGEGGRGRWGVACCLVYTPEML